MSLEVEEIRVIELHMMDKRKYFPLTLASGLTVRSLLYPFMLIKTRLQIQRGHSVYKGTFDALYKIGSNEGVSGLYRGFWVSCLQLFPSMVYITSYEHTRHYMAHNLGMENSHIRSFVGGGIASVIGQTLAVPLDIVTQHLMLMGRRDSTADAKKAMSDSGAKATEKQKVTQQKAAQQKLSTLQRIHVSEADRKSRIGGLKAVIRAVYKEGGVKGFYKGYFVSLACFAPNSALWWFFYDSYSVLLTNILPENTPRMGLQVIAAPMGGISAAVLTNPLDVIRSRIQVEGTHFSETISLLWKEEGMWLVTKGLSARIVQSVAFSCFVVLGYESVKRVSLLDEYRNRIRW